MERRGLINSIPSDESPSQAAKISEQKLEEGMKNGTVTVSSNTSVDKETVQISSHIQNLAPQLATKRASSPKDIAFPKQLAILTDSASINRYHSQRRNVAATPTNKAPKRRHSGKPSKATTRPGRELQCNRAVTSAHFWNRAAPTRKDASDQRRSRQRPPAAYHPKKITAKGVRTTHSHQQQLSIKSEPNVEKHELKGHLPEIPTGR